MKTFLLLISTALFATTALQAGPYSYAKHNKFYFQTSAGLSHMTKTASSGFAGISEYDENTGLQVTGAIGRYFDSVRLELEYSFRRIGMKGRATANPSDTNGNVFMNSAMLNLLYEAPLGDAMFFYAGGGIGLSLVKFKTETSSDRDSTFSMQIMTGAGYRITNKLSLLLGYRYFRTLDTKYRMGGRSVSVGRQSIHNFETGLRLDF